MNQSDMTHLAPREAAVVDLLTAKDLADETLRAVQHDPLLRDRLPHRLVDAIDAYEAAWTFDVPADQYATLGRAS